MFLEEKILRGEEFGSFLASTDSDGCRCIGGSLGRLGDGREIGGSWREVFWRNENCLDDSRKGWEDLEGGER